MVLAFAACSAVLAAHAESYLPFFADDGFISLRYADRLLHGQGLTWSDGGRVEGFSNLLWTLGCSVLGAMRVNLVLAARMLGVGSALAALAALARSVRPDLSPIRASLTFAAGALALVSAGPFAVWTIGGLEQPLVAALLLWGVVETARLPSTAPRAWRSLLPAGVPFGLLAWTRPDGALFGVVIAITLGLLDATATQSDRRARLQAAARAGRLLAFPLAFVVAQLAFRLAYYGEWLPNPAFAKLAFTAERAREGWVYVLTSVSVHINTVLLASAAVVPAVQDRAARRRIALACAPLAAWLLYVVVIGGDIFPARRHFVPVLALLALLIIEAVGWAGRRSLPWRGTAAAGVAVAVVFGALRQTADPQLQRAERERWEWLGEPVGTLLGRHFGQDQALLATDSAGTLPYFSRLPSIDLLGLNDKTMAHHPPAGYGRGALGHELGDGVYVMSRAPDLVVFGLPTGEEHALYRSGIQMQRDPSFYQHYSLLTWEADGETTVRSRIWVRRDGRIGIRAADDMVQIPGYFVASQPNVVAREDSEGRLGAVVTPYGAGAVRTGPLRAGEWVVRAEFTGSAPRLTVSMAERELAFGTGQVRFSLDQPQTDGVTIRVGAVGASVVHVRELRLERSAQPAGTGTTP